MERDQIAEMISIHGTDAVPADGEVDLEEMAIDVLVALPVDVQEWFFNESRHVFITLTDARAAMIRLNILPAHRAGDMIDLRVIALGPGLAKEPAAHVRHTIAHEIAHSRLGHWRIERIGKDEAAADQLAAEWGFTVPAARRAERDYFTGARMVDPSP